jgi:phosphoglycerate dehydrogenase-like enzyme
MNVMVTELIQPEGLEELEAFADVEYDPQLWRDPDALREKVESANALIVRSQTRVDSTLLEHGTSLKALGRLGVGLDNIDLDRRTGRLASRAPSKTRLEED